MMLIIQSICLLLLNVKAVLMVSTYPKLLVVSYDAFRYDYFHRNFTPFMNSMKHQGTDVDYMINAFVTRTLPNHHTMATGFYIETHGVLENKMLTPDGNIMNATEVFHYNEAIHPIWTINEKNGRHSGAMMWPGSEFKYDGITPSYAMPLNTSMPWESRAKKLISLYRDPINPINLGILYIEEPDFHAHGLGTEHPVINNLLAKLDNFTKFIHDHLVEMNLTDINVIHLSDHGMLDVNMSGIVNITELVDRSDYLSLATPNTMFIKPHKGKEDLVYEKLKAAAKNTSAFDVYRSNEIPERFHYGNNERMSPIFVVAKSNFAFEALKDSFLYYEKEFNITINNQSKFGQHGYDNEDPRMRPMFFARGPAFRTHCKLEPFNNVDLFPLFCHILNLTCPLTNGTLESFKKCLTNFPQDGKMVYGRSMLIAVLTTLGIVGTVSMMAMLYLRNKHRREEVVYRRILDDAKMDRLWDEHHDSDHMWH